MTTEDLSTALKSFTGSDEFVRWSPLFRHVATQGAKYLAEEADAYWLLDLIASHQLEPKVAAEGFQVWTLKVKDNTAVAEATDGNDNIIARQEIEYTDFPLAEITLWAVTNERGYKTIMLPSEY